MGPGDGTTPGAGRGGRRAARIENALIWLSILALWPWILRGRWVFKGRWIWVVLGFALVAMLAVAVRRISRWSGLGWRPGAPGREGRGNE